VEGVVIAEFDLQPCRGRWRSRRAAVSASSLGDGYRGEIFFLALLVLLAGWADVRGSGGVAVAFPVPRQKSAGGKLLISQP
jgi:hypothetical protein